MDDRIAVFVMQAIPVTLENETIGSGITTNTKWRNWTIGNAKLEDVGSISKMGARSSIASSAMFDEAKL